MSMRESHPVEGHVSRGFEAVREAFAENFAGRRELGGACCAYHRGEKVVDLWGGIRNKQTGEPWEQDTMVIVYSATKGLAAMTLAIAHSRGWLDYEERVCTYWPEFAQQGKERITVRQLLAHQAGLFALDEPVDRSVVADLDRLAVVLARQKPAWEPGTRQAYHAHHARVLRRRAAAPRRSPASQPGTVLSGRDRDAARAGRLHPAARGDPELAPGHDCAARLDRDAARLPASLDAGRDESTLQHLPGAQGFRAAARRAARLRAQPRSAVRRRRRHGPRHRARLQRLRHRRPRAGIAPGDAGPAGRAGDSPDARVLRRMYEGATASSSRSAS